MPCIFSDSYGIVKPSGFIIARNKIYLSLNNGRLVKIDAEVIRPNHPGLEDHCNRLREFGQTNFKQLPNQIQQKIIPNLGMRRQNHTGNLIINFNVEFPKTLSMEKINSLEKIL